MMVGIALSSIAMAQSTATKVEMDKKKTEKELKNVIKEKKDEKKEAANDLALINYAAILLITGFHLPDFTSKIWTSSRY